ncbi:uncharacterized protein F5891DRAFT_1187282 [Suillus fuscotomentosus]|uniref:Uncharacterized protein n=1 Tax=Suillus fuscotomentosus TaxID=1912939 RepID=A0AAD4E909_9AGAM|nr:uncharacterized protein F5891DRAFT_1187282 [Suillus fuscotomentosus]KAG1901805.1 hypothetical protein F5891DRAFT_1187282 [Suillus fuscotomentosus]
MPMQMPLWLSVAEVNELTADHFKQQVCSYWNRLLIRGWMIRSFNNFMFYWTEVARLGLDLGQMLVAKLEATGAAVDAMNLS